MMNSSSSISVSTIKGQRVCFGAGLSLSAPAKGRHTPKINKAISVGFIAATLRLSPRLLKGGCGGDWGFLEVAPNIFQHLLLAYSSNL
jgi:hypothetical protein